MTLKTIAADDNKDMINYNYHHTEVKIHYGDDILYYYLIHESYIANIELNLSICHVPTAEERVITFRLKFMVARIGIKSFTYNGAINN